MHESNNRKAKYLVTGGGGFLGKAIVRRLLGRGDRVRSFSRRLYPELDELGVEQVQGDLGDVRAVRRSLDDIHTVFHTAAKPPPWGRYKDYYQTNVVGTQNIIDGCVGQKVEMLVYTSSPSVIFNGENLEGIDESFPYPARHNAYYPKTKAMAERLAVEAGRDRLRTIVLRPHQIWGPEDPHFVPRLITRAKKLKRIGNGNNLVDTTYIDNAVNAHLLAADRLEGNTALSGKIYFISQGDPVPFWDMIDAVLAAAGLDPVKGSISHGLAWSIGAVMEVAYRTFRIPGEPRMTRFLADAVAKSHWFDISAARKDLDYEPEVTTQEGLVRLEDWLKADSMVKR